MQTNQNTSVTHLFFSFLLASLLPAIFWITSIFHSWDQPYARGITLIVFCVISILHLVFHLLLGFALPRKTKLLSSALFITLGLLSGYGLQFGLTLAIGGLDLALKFNFEQFIGALYGLLSGAALIFLIPKNNSPDSQNSW